MPNPCPPLANRPNPCGHFAWALPALDLFPRKLWSRLAVREARRLSKASLAYPDPLGLPALREAIASYLAVSRGIACQPEQIAITGGYQAALNLTARLLLAPGDLVWFEDPGYGFARNALQSLSFRIAPIPVDGEGLCVAHGAAIFSAGAIGCRHAGASIAAGRLPVPAAPAGLAGLGGQSGCLDIGRRLRLRIPL